MTGLPMLHLSAPSHPDAVKVAPIILAPMAGVTNAAFRQLCREQGAGLYICEMITSRGLIVGDRKTHDMLYFPPGETPRSVQTYGTNPAAIAKAVDILCQQYRVNHIDLNFGCPVPKVTRKGGGGVLPWKLDLVREILTAAVKHADHHGVPVTLKTRIGITEELTTFMDMGRLAEDTGIAGICLHARTVAQAYSGQARWGAITKLVQAVDIPVIGNGDIWEAQDALDMMRQSGCAAVEVGRGCLGRPWLFKDLAAALAGREITTLPRLGEITRLVYRHGELLAAYQGEERGMKDIRKHIAWYFKGFPVGGELRSALGQVSTLNELAGLLGQLDPDIAYPVRELGRPRGRQGSPRTKVAMPYGWLDDRCGLGLNLSDAELVADGG